MTAVLSIGPFFTLRGGGRDACIDKTRDKPALFLAQSYPGPVEDNTGVLLGLRRRVLRAKPAEMP